MTQAKCRFCNSDLNQIFVDLGQSPLANSYIKKNDFENEKDTIKKLLEKKKKVNTLLLKK